MLKRKRFQIRYTTGRGSSIIRQRNNELGWRVAWGMYGLPFPFGNKQDAEAAADWLESKVKDTSNIIEELTDMYGDIQKAIDTMISEVCRW